MNNRRKRSDWGEPRSPPKRSKPCSEQSCWLFQLPADVWLLVRDLASAEEAIRFALACQQSLALVLRPVFWQLFEQPVFDFSSAVHRRILRFFTPGCAEAKCPLKELVLKQPYYQDRDGWSDYQGYSLDKVTVETLILNGRKKAPFKDERRVLDEFGSVLNLVAEATTDICRSLSGCNSTRALRSLVIARQSTFNDLSLRILQNLPQLQSLSLHTCPAITDPGLTCLRLVLKLEDLSITDCESITGLGVRNMPLRKLKFEDFNHNGNLLAQLPSLTRLQELDLWDYTPLSPAEVDTLNKNLQKLRFALDERATDALLSKVAGLRGLQALSLPHCPNITEGGLQQLQRCQALEELWLKGQFAALDVLHACPVLRTLTLDGSETKAPTGLTGCKKLQLLTLYACTITNATLSDLRGCRLLQEIQFTFCKITGDITELKNCPSLREVSFDQCVRLRQERLDQLRRARPDLQIL